MLLLEKLPQASYSEKEALARRDTMQPMALNALSLQDLDAFDLPGADDPVERLFKAVDSDDIVGVRAMLAPEVHGKSIQEKVC